MLDDNFVYGLIAGLGIMALLNVFAKITYRKILQSCADQKTPEKLPDGKFYYLVREDEYSKYAAVRLAALAEERKKKNSQEPTTG